MSGGFTVNPSLLKVCLIRTCAVIIQKKCSSTIEEAQYCAANLEFCILAVLPHILYTYKEARFMSDKGIS